MGVLLVWGSQGVYGLGGWRSQGTNHHHPIATQKIGGVGADQIGYKLMKVTEKG